MSLLSVIERARNEGDPGLLVAAVPHASYLGLGVEIEPGRLITRLPFRPNLVGNPRLPALHGGVVGALLELAATFELLWAMESVAIPRCVSLSVDYLRSAGPRESRAAGRVTRLGRRVANVQVTAWQDDPDRPIAHAHAHFLIAPPEARSAEGGGR